MGAGAVGDAVEGGHAAGADPPPAGGGAAGASPGGGRVGAEIAAGVPAGGDVRARAGGDGAQPRVPEDLSGTGTGPRCRAEEGRGGPAKRWGDMDASSVVLAVLTLAVFLAAHLRGGRELPLAGLRAGGALLLGIAPRLLVGFALAGVFTVLAPTEAVARWMGQEAGLRGILVGTVAGMLTRGGPFVLFPLVAALVHRGAALGPVAAHVTAWGLIPLRRLLVWEIPMLGLPMALAPALASLRPPVLAGVLTPALFRVLQALVGRSLTRGWAEGAQPASGLHAAAAACRRGIAGLRLTPRSDGRATGALGDGPYHAV